jgi:hypothetical protein
MIVFTIIGLMTTAVLIWLSLSIIHKNLSDKKLDWYIFIQEALQLPWYLIFGIKVKNPNRAKELLDIMAERKVAKYRILVHRGYLWVLRRELKKLNE